MSLFSALLGMQSKKSPSEGYIAFTSPNNFAIEIDADTTVPQDRIYELKYAIDSGNWQDTTIGSIIQINAGATLYIRNNTTNTPGYDEDYYYKFTITSGSNVKLFGKLSALINDQRYTTGKNSFTCLFGHNSGLTEVDPDLLDVTFPTDSCDIFSYMFVNTRIKYAPKLPQMQLAKNCYVGMFYGCTSLVDAPELPATTLANNCYSMMFYGCTSLVNVPDLSATTLASYCCQYMFQNCSSLANAPKLPAIKLVSYCYYGMFYGCTNLTQAPELPAISLSSYCYVLMFSGCTSLVNAPSLPATTLAQGCYQSMFNGCTSLVNAPKLPAPRLTTTCYYRMFYDCTSLKEIYCNARYSSSSGTAEITTSISSYWLQNVPNTTDCVFHKNPEWSGPTSRGVNTIPSNWQIVDWIQ